MRKYEVTFLASGKATRIVEAKDKKDALQKAKKMLFDADGVTPKKSALMAFAWDFPHGYTYGDDGVELDTE